MKLCESVYHEVCYLFFNVLISQHIFEVKKYIEVKSNTLKKKTAEKL